MARVSPARPRRQAACRLALLRPRRLPPALPGLSLIAIAALLLTADECECPGIDVAAPPPRARRHFLHGIAQALRPKRLGQGHIDSGIVHGCFPRRPDDDYD